MTKPNKRRDWRWFVGGVGRVLIALGLLMFGFVAYQLWGTGLRTAQAQSRLSDEFTELLSEAVATTSPTSPDGTVTVTSDPVTSDPVTSDPATAPTSAAPPTTTIPSASISAPPSGEPLARLDIPRIGMEGTIIIEGVSPSDLRDGPGHFPETPLPGQYGNAALAGHRTTHGQPFSRVDELAPGDDIIVTTLAGRYTYVVTGTVIVGPNDYRQVIPTVDPTRATIVLTSCHPRWSTRQRIVVAAELDQSRSDVVTAPGPPRPASDIGALPSDDTSNSVPVTVDSTAAPAGSAPGVTAVTGSGPVGSAPAGTTDPATSDAAAESTDVARDDDGEPTGADVFGSGWFSDEDAFLAVGLWGLVLTAIALASWAISRRVGRNWVGGLLGIVPFLIVLYLFYEDVNRLLPANL